jgi:fatty acid desaturase
VVGVHIAAVFGAVYAAALLGPRPLVVLAWLWFGLLVNGLVHLMHECAHLLTFRSRVASEWFGRWVLAPLVLADFDGYRARHWVHHKRLGESDDTKTAYRIDVRRTAVGKLLLRSLILVEAAERFAQQTRAADESGRKPGGMRKALARCALVQSLFLGSIALAAWVAHRDFVASAWSVAVAYGFVYFYGLACLTVLTATLRTIAEHQVGAGGLISGRAALRNIATNPVSLLVFGAYGFADHATHHREPGLPYYQLPARTAEIAASEPALAPTQGYLATLAALIRRGTAAME